MQYLDGLYAYAMTLTRNPAEAEDLVQETYLRAMGTDERPHPGSHIKSWLFTIQRNLWLNKMGGNWSSMPELEIDEEGSELTESGEKHRVPCASYLNRLKQSDMRNAIEKLPAKYREVIVLREFEELSYQQIALVLGCPTGTVMSRLGHARDKLKQVLEQWSFGGNSMARGTTEL